MQKREKIAKRANTRDEIAKNTQKRARTRDYCKTARNNAQTRKKTTRESTKNDETNVTKRGRTKRAGTARARSVP